MKRESNESLSSVLIVSVDVYLIDTIKKDIELRYKNKVDVIVTNNVFDARNEINSKNISILLLDIHLPLVNGFELIKNLVNNSLKTIVIANNNDYVSEALKYNVFDYLIKPLEISDINRVLSKENLIINPDFSLNKIVINSHKAFKIINPDEIIWIEAHNSYSKIYTKDNGVYKTSKSMSYYEKLLLHEKFYRIHRSHMINTNFVKG